MNHATTEAPTRRLAAVALSALALAACTAYGPGDVRTGQSADDVARSMGAPTARYPQPGGVLTALRVYWDNALSMQQLGLLPG